MKMRKQQKWIVCWILLLAQSQVETQGSLQVVSNNEADVDIVDSAHRLSKDITVNNETQAWSDVDDRILNNDTRTLDVITSTTKNINTSADFFTLVTTSNDDNRTPEGVVLSATTPNKDNKTFEDVVSSTTTPNKESRTFEDVPSATTPNKDNKTFEDVAPSATTQNKDSKTFEDVALSATTSNEDNKTYADVSLATIPNYDNKTIESVVSLTTMPTEDNTTLDDFRSSSTDGLGSNTTEIATPSGVISTYVSYVITPLFLVTGLLGNALTIAVMTSRSFSSMTMSVILIALAVSDTSVLLMHPFMKLWFIKLLGKDIRALSDESCRFFFVLFRTSKLCSSWFVVLVCFERLIAVYLPLRARIINTKRNVVISLAVIVASFLTYNGFWTYSSSLVKDGFCFSIYSLPEIATQQKTFSMVGTLIYGGIPTIIMAILTPAIIVRILQQSKVRRSLASMSVKKSNQNQRTVAMLLSVAIAYIILATPIAIIFNVALVQRKNLFQSTDPALSIVREVAQTLELLNYSINFFLYVASSDSFRARIADIFGCRKGRNRRLSFGLSSRVTQLDSRTFN